MPHHYPEKDLLYKLCNVLLREKTTVAGIGRDTPITIGLQDLMRKVEIAMLTKQKARELKKEIVRLCKEKDSEKRWPLLKVRNHELEDFYRRVQNNDSITFDYRSIDIEEYVEYLREGDARGISHDDYNKLRFICELGNNRFEYKSIPPVKVVENDSTRSITLNVCLLMYGHKITLLFNKPINNQEAEEPLTALPDYKVGSDVQISVLYEIIYYDSPDNDTLNRARGDRYRPIRDAITHINHRVNEKFGKNVFQYENQRVKVIHI